MWKLYRSFRWNASLSALRNKRIDDFEFVEIFKMFERDGNSFIRDEVGEFVVSQRSARVHCTCTNAYKTRDVAFSFSDPCILCVSAKNSSP